jgi:hypothetical protein
VERNRKASQNPPRVVAQSEEEEDEEGEKKKKRRRTEEDEEEEEEEQAVFERPQSDNLKSNYHWAEVYFRTGLTKVLFNFLKLFITYGNEA